MRPRPAAAVPGDLAVREVELRVQHADRPELGREVHRVQLAPASLGNGAADTTAGSIQDMFDFHNGSNPRLFLDPNTGEPISYGYWAKHFKKA